MHCCLTVRAVFRKQTSTLIQRIAQSVMVQLPGEGGGLQGRLDPVIQARNRDVSEAFKTLERQTLEFSDTLMVCPRLQLRHHLHSHPKSNAHDAMISRRVMHMHVHVLCQSAAPRASMRTCHPRDVDSNAL